MGEREAYGDGDRMLNQPTAQQYDTGLIPENGEQHYALCLQGIPDQTKKCYGKYIDNLVLDRVLGDKTILIYFGTCTAATTLCEGGRTLGIGTLWGLVDSALVCGIPAGMSYWTRGRVAERLKETGGKVTLDWKERGLLYGGMIGGLTLAKIAQFRAFSLAAAILRGGISAVLAKRTLIAKVARSGAKKLAELLKKVKDVKVLAGAAYIAETQPQLLFQYNQTLEAGTLKEQMLLKRLRKAGTAVGEGKIPPSNLLNITTPTPRTPGERAGTTQAETGRGAPGEIPPEEAPPERVPPEAPGEGGIPGEKIKELGKGLGCPIAGLIAGTIAANLYAGDTIFHGIDMEKLTITYEENKIQVENIQIGG